MTALTQDRNTARAAGDVKSLGVEESTFIFGGAIVMRNAAGYAVNGRTATGLIGESVDGVLPTIGVVAEIYGIIGDPVDGSAPVIDAGVLSRHIPMVSLHH